MFVDPLKHRPVWIRLSISIILNAKVLAFLSSQMSTLNGRMDQGQGHWGLTSVPIHLSCSCEHDASETLSGNFFKFNTSVESSMNCYSLLGKSHCDQTDEPENSVHCPDSRLELPHCFKMPLQTSKAAGGMHVGLDKLTCLVVGSRTMMNLLCYDQSSFKTSAPWPSWFLLWSKQKPLVSLMLTLAARRYDLND